MRKELRRKLFHLLSLAYLIIFIAWKDADGGHAGVSGLLGAWTILEGAVELARLKIPRLNRRLMSLLGAIHREEEALRVSGIFWTAAGAWLTIRLFGSRSQCVIGALLYLSLGDTAAALAGLAFGQIRLGRGRRVKTLEGSLACFATCLVAGYVAGLSIAAAGLGAAVATLLEALPLPINDNLWMPLGSALALWLVV